MQTQFNCYDVDLDLGSWLYNIQVHLSLDTVFGVVKVKNESKGKSQKDSQ